MKLTKEIKDKIDDVAKTFAKGNTTIVSVGLGQKVSAGKVTGDSAIVIGVTEKKPIEELSSDEMIPSEVTVGDTVIKIDIIQQSPVQLFSCTACGGWNGSNSGQFTNRQFTRPLRGGVTMTSINNTPSVGTLGTFVQDIASGAIVALTNNHVTIENPTYTSDRNLAALNVENDYDPINRIYQGTEAVGQIQPVNEVGISLRYAPIHLASTGFVNQVDAAIYSVNFQDIETESVPSSQQYASWQPIGLESVITNQNPPFATTAELDDIFNTNPDVWSSGRTSGARGKGICGFLRVYGSSINLPNVGTALGPVGYNDIIAVIRPSDDDSTSQQPGCFNPGLQGDSGSAVYAEFGSVKKLIGLLFAGNCIIGTMPVADQGNECCSGQVGVNSCSTVFYLCRIDKIAEQLGVEWWDAAAVNQYTVKKDTIAYVTEIGGSDQRTKLCNGKLHYQAGLTNTLNNPCIPTP